MKFYKFRKLVLICISLSFVLLSSACSKEQEKSKEKPKEQAKIETSNECKDVVSKYEKIINTNLHIRKYVETIDNLIHGKAKDLPKEKRVFIASCLLKENPLLSKVEITKSKTSVSFYYAKKNVWGNLFIDKEK